MIRCDGCDGCDGCDRCDGCDGCDRCDRCGCVVDGSYQHREQITVIAAARAAVGDHAVDHCVEAALRSGCAPQPRYRQPLEKLSARQKVEPEGLEDLGHGLADFIGL